jgi:dipeptidyl aminopeptidase/acylaminoacyl peptidase
MLPLSFNFLIFLHIFTTSKSVNTMRTLYILSFISLICFNNISVSNAQSTTASTAMTPEKLWSLSRLGQAHISYDGNAVIYRVSTPDIEGNTFKAAWYASDLITGATSQIMDAQSRYPDKHLSPDGKYKLHTRRVKLMKVQGADFYPELSRSNAQIYNSLDYRHWDTWQDGTFNHLFFGPPSMHDSTYIDILGNEPYHCPQQPFGGDEDYTWSNDSKAIVFVSKQLTGTAYVQSTNTDLYRYDLTSGKTQNLTSANKGYDTHPVFSSRGDLAYLSMKTDGYESDKNDIVVFSNGVYTNLTEKWDGTVNNFIWNVSGDMLYFTAATDGTVQVFEVPFNSNTGKPGSVKQLTSGKWDVGTLIGLSGDLLITTRLDMNHAAEIYSYDLKTNTWKKISSINDAAYSSIPECPTEKQYVTTSDGKQMLVWVVYPPNFDKSKKYPVLLYCQGGPQSALTQFYSFRWNLSLMASQGYIVVAPNRRGMPGQGVEWNRQISGDWGGQNMRDYLSAIDHVAKEPYVDKDRMGAVGASYGGYSVFYLAGIHNKRFKTFIAHDGIFNTYSMYGTTEEMFFVNFDLGGPYWEEKNRKSYTDFNPMMHVSKWDTPIFIIQGGKDYRVPEGQGQEAFNAAQLRGIKSRFLYLPEEHHWVMKPQNSLVWQREFFKWLKETL